FYSVLPRHATATLSPYTTLFRSIDGDGFLGAAGIEIGIAHHEDLRSVFGVLTDGEQVYFMRFIQSPGPAQQLTQRVQRSSQTGVDRKSTRLNSSHVKISYAVFCL